MLSMDCKKLFLVVQKICTCLNHLQNARLSFFLNIIVPYRIIFALIQTGSVQAALHSINK